VAKLVLTLACIAAAIAFTGVLAVRTTEIESTDVTVRQVMLAMGCGVTGIVFLGKCIDRLIDRAPGFGSRALAHGAAAGLMIGIAATLTWSPQFLAAEPPSVEEFADRVLEEAQRAIDDAPDAAAKRRRLDEIRWRLIVYRGLRDDYDEVYRIVSDEQWERYREEVARRFERRKLELKAAALRER
jgi:hypothetical protein